ncbi:hypothetical protein SCUP515_00373 [Seiridium cupressi]
MVGNCGGISQPIEQLDVEALERREKAEKMPHLFGVHHYETVVKVQADRIRNLRDEANNLSDALFASQNQLRGLQVNHRIISIKLEQAKQEITILEAVDNEHVKIIKNYDVRIAELEQNNDNVLQQLSSKADKLSRNLRSQNDELSQKLRSKNVELTQNLEYIEILRGNFQAQQEELEQAQAKISRQADLFSKAEARQMELETQRLQDNINHEHRVNGLSRRVRAQKFVNQTLSKIRHQQVRELQNLRSERIYIMTEREQVATERDQLATKLDERKKYLKKLRGRGFLLLIKGNKKGSRDSRVSKSPHVKAEKEGTHPGKVEAWEYWTLDLSGNVLEASKTKSA